MNCIDVKLQAEFNIWRFYLYNLYRCTDTEEVFAFFISIAFISIYFYKLYDTMKVFECYLYV